MSIGTTIKKLRRDKGITQEQLAELLGLSTNAISQWECDKTAPDISHLPVLANIFEVSADILLEIDIAKSKKKAEIEKFLAEESAFFNQGKTEERLQLCRAMQKKYPNDETVRYRLMWVLRNASDRENFDEIISIGEQLLKSENTNYRMGAISCLCFTHLRVGDKKAARQYADMMPQHTDLHLHVLEGNDLVLHCQNYFWKVCDDMHLYMKYLLDCPEAKYTPEQKHTMWKMLYDIVCIIFSDKDFGFYNDRLATFSFFMAAQSAKIGEFERALDELELMTVHLEALQSFSQIQHTSLLVNTIKVAQSDIFKSQAETLGQTYLRHITKPDSLFIPTKDTPRYAAITERLAKL